MSPKVVLIHPPHLNATDDRLDPEKVCACGCGGKIIFKPHHKYRGIPKYISGHNSHTEEQKEKTSNKMKGSGNPMYGKKRPDLVEYNKKPETLEKRRNQKLNSILSEDIKQKISKTRLENGLGKGELNGMFGKRHSEESKEKCRIGVTNYFLNNPQARDLLRNYRLNQTIPLISSLEIKVYSKLNEFGMYPEPQYPIEITIPDFVFLQEKIAIYVDGCYWHGCPMHFPQSKKGKRDNYINEFLKRRGWKVLRFWEHDINNDIDGVINKIIKEVK